ncbi:hypothetical protein CBOM_03126 [Ceraceosorus bombacis]|uniref:Uncharacterized protein n=1 Tax=Ceraceosorus bombacis TaxID=401625 RepID=A0A0P1BN68_9BASI|nr:hypothetical protein CBOM_03126 [Ceraceosorus bombacis]
METGKTQCEAAWRNGSASDYDLVLELISIDSACAGPSEPWAWVRNSAPPT